MAFKVPLIQANLHLTGTRGGDSYTILKTDKVRETGGRSFASVLLARHNGEEVVLNISSTYYTDFEHVSRLILVFPLLTLSLYLFAGLDGYNTV